MNQAITPAHEQRESFHEVILYPEHLQRTESLEFKQNKHHLIQELGLGCWICGAREHLEVHHFGIEWALWESVDPARVLEVLTAFDPYGFTASDLNTPLTSPDDIRNLMPLCEKHHRHPYFGVHALTMPIWIAQRSTKPGVQITKDPSSPQA